MTSETGLARRDALTAVAAVAASGLATSAVAQPATDDDRKALAESYLKSLDAGGVSPTTGLGLFDHFSEDAEVFFPKWGVARGKAEVIRMFTDVGGTLKGIKHHYDRFTWYMNGSDSFAVEGTSEGEHRDGPWDADTPKWAAGRFCDCFTVKDGKITRLFIYLDPDYAGKDTARYGWITA
ncbi:MAG: nuclear transport factor 2 family protein [Tabrizicola sp.]|uniref:nuclear transport factor 2 family protein n=1 Tax=Tabrizicola sp. TaxID=2005166 RepID=UPI002736D5B2|nr:nuclear transport factor 2 family protein [Tabrizicola sp.]MDP3264597.1 nuclear transport factor 2 family protein [Tabrizicola sp.]MDP3647723.1 nuclear transport factor 2 family protein [Paracoccaceae bacterium]